MFYGAASPKVLEPLVKPPLYAYCTTLVPFSVLPRVKERVEPLIPEAFFPHWKFVKILSR